MANTLTFFCTRPLLAEKLILQGFNPEITINPWEPSRMAWKFEPTPELAEFVAAFYAELGKPLPSSAAKVFRDAEVLV